MAALIPQLVLTESAALTMGLIRNECREFMTRSRSEITPEKQLSWFRSLDRRHTLPWLFSIENHAPVAYGLMRRQEQDWWLSIGVTANCRGQGYGKAAFRYMTDLVERAWLEVLETNLVAQRVYVALGYRVLRHDDGIITMVHIR